MMLKMAKKDIFWGSTGPPKTSKNAKTGVLGAPLDTRKIFFHHFQYFIDLFGLSALQCTFTIYFTLTLRWYMMFLVKVGFLAFFSAFSLGKNQTYIKPVVGARRQHFFPPKVTYSDVLL